MEYKCTNCGYTYPEELFYKYSIERFKGGFLECKECTRARSDESRLKKRYGLTVEEVQSMMSEQEGECGCCGKEFIEIPCIDHCHDTGQIRGLLCRQCNAGIGLLGDTEEGVMKAIDYLRRK